MVGQKGTAQAIRDRLNDGAWNDAERKAHSLKGVTNQIGAVEIADIAPEIELDIKAETRTEKLFTLINAFDTALKRLVDELERRLITLDPDAVMDTKTTPIHLARRRALLLASDVDVVEFLEAYRKFLRGFLAQDYRLLEQSVRAYDVDTGLSILRRHDMGQQETASNPFAKRGAKPG